MPSRPAISTNGCMLSHLPILVEIMEHKKSDPLHWHDYSQIWYVLQGSLLHTLNGVQHIQKPGECAVILPYSIHSIDSRICDDDIYILSISYPDDFLTSRGYDIFSYSKEHPRFAGKAIPSYATLTGERKDFADKVAKAMISEFSKHKEMSFDVLASLLSDFLGNLCTEPANELKNLNVVAERAYAITDSIHYIASNLDKKLSLDHLCARACMSKCAFTKNFKYVTGMTSKEFLLTARLLKASSFLSFTDKNLDEISKEVGFYDSAYLIRAFKERFGRSPKQYREYARNDAIKMDEVFREKWAWFFGDTDFGHGDVK